MHFPDHVRTEKVSVWNGTIDMAVRIAGAGPPLFYLHAAAGLSWTPFLEELSREHTVIAPHFPGTAPEDPHAIHRIDSLGDLVLIYEETVRKLGLETPIVVGESFGAMLACELAAVFTGRFAKLVLLAPIGLWDEAMPVANWIAVPPEQMPRLLFADPQGPAARSAFDPGSDPERAVKAQAALVWSIGCTGKFVWPIPEKGLHKRLHRISASTLLLWGSQDRLIPPDYAALFEQGIADARTHIIEGAGHALSMEAAEAAAHHLLQFIGTNRAARGAA